MVPSINRSLFLGALVASLKAEAAHISSSSKPIAISKAAPNTAGIPLDSFVSFSFEFSSWPDFAGMLTAVSGIIVEALLTRNAYRQSVASECVHIQSHEQSWQTSRFIANRSSGRQYTVLLYVDHAWGHTQLTQG